MKELICVYCGGEVERLPNEPEMGDGYSFWKRYRCKKCGRKTGFQGVKEKSKCS